MIDQAMGDNACHSHEYLSGENDVPVCFDISGDKWENEFMSQIGNEGEDEEDEEDDPEHPKLLSRPVCTRQCFLENKGHVNDALRIGSVVDSVLSLKLREQKQTTLHRFF